MTQRRIHIISRFDVALLVFMIAVRIALIVYLYPDKNKFLDGDSAYYEGLAVHFLQHGIYLHPSGGKFSDLLRPPGYPAFIMLNYALFGTEAFLALVLWNIVGVGLTYWGIKKLLLRLDASPQPLTLIFFALDLAWILYSKDLVTEPLFTPLLIVSVLQVFDFLENKTLKPCIIAALLMGITALIKPITLYLPLVIMPIMYLFTRNYRAGIVFALVFIATISPWLIRNKLTHNTFSFTSIQNQNLLYAHGAFVYADLYKTTHLQAQSMITRELYHFYPDFDQLSYADMNRATGKLARKILAEHPFLYAKAIVRGMAITLFDPGRMVFNQTFPSEDPQQIGFTDTIGKIGLWGTFKLLLQKNPLTVVVLVSYLLLLSLANAFAFAGIYAFWKHQPMYFVCISALVLYLLLLGGPNGYARFRLYIFPFWLLYANYGISACKAWLQSKLSLFKP